jgi:hypothetical protein
MLPVEKYQLTDEKSPEDNRLHERETARGNDD